MKLFVKITKEDGSVFTQELPRKIAKGTVDEKTGEYQLDKEATLAALKKRVEDKDDVLDYGKDAFELVEEPEKLEIDKAIADAEAKATEQAEAEFNSEAQVKRRERVVKASEELTKADFVTAAEGVVSHDKDIAELKGGDGASVLSNLVELTRKQDAVIRDGTSYPNIQKAVVLVFDRDKPASAADGLPAVLKELGLGETDPQVTKE